jgi:hypothetical protein
MANIRNCNINANANAENNEENNNDANLPPPFTYS